MKLLITGDLVVNRPYDVSKMIDKKLIELFEQSDYNIVNLEAPITDNNIKTLKTGPNIKSNKYSTLDVLQTLSVNAVTLANNHVLDYGEQGVVDTLKFCRENKIETVGAGMNITEASKTIYVNSSEGIIAIVNFAENEWSAATSDSAGFNPMNVIDNTYQIQEARKNAAYVMVIIHGGHEYYNLPSPRIQKQYRFYAEQGADIIVAHHTHCISGNEIYKGVPIFYSLANFLFTHDSSESDWYNGLILEVLIKDNKLTPKLYAVEQVKKTFKLKLSESNIAFERIDKFNKIIHDSIKLNESWTKYVQEKSKSFINYWSPISMINNRYISAVINKLNLKLTNKKGLALFLNLIRCEAHSDLSKEILKKALEK